METEEAQFRQWFVDSMAPLRANGHSGFIFMFVAFPLLERHLRRKSGLTDGGNLNNQFHSELALLFPDIADRTRHFWQCYRHGLLHQGTFKNGYTDRDTQQWIQLPNSAISGHDTRPVYYVETEKQFFVNPMVFYDRVISAILSEFSTFSVAGDFPLARVYDPTSFAGLTVPTIGLFTGTGFYALPESEIFIQEPNQAPPSGVAPTTPNSPPNSSQQLP